MSSSQGFEPSDLEVLIECEGLPEAENIPFAWSKEMVSLVTREEVTASRPGKTAFFALSCH